MREHTQDYPVPADCDDQRFRWLFDYWRSRHRGELLPGRENVDPLDFPHLLGRVHLIEVVRAESGRLRYRVRLWGSIIRDMFGADHTGRWLDETLLPGSATAVMATLDDVVARRRPHFWRRPMSAENEVYVATRRLLLPLAADGVEVDMLLGLIVEERASR